MKHRPVTKLDKKRRQSQKNLTTYNVMSTTCDVIVIFLIYGQSGAILKPDSGRVVCITNIFININLLSYEN